ncbi:hypothetical protein B0T22DRAFT_281153 [Podospora appendiculata]|uniref:Uncharacterized protein n=1 Tax=Podospora appendiculata TaxID=314037 RepID=A0AAE1C827_9PEZI|nr:hypothetical protein B0T22DRAFT_281153 [Podospora appendiculata]
MVRRFDFRPVKKDFKLHLLFGNKMTDEVHPTATFRLRSNFLPSPVFACIDMRYISKWRALHFPPPSPHVPKSVKVKAQEPTIVSEAPAPATAPANASMTAAAATDGASSPAQAESSKPAQEPSAEPKQPDMDSKPDPESKPTPEPEQKAEQDSKPDSKPDPAAPTAKPEPDPAPQPAQPKAIPNTPVAAIRAKRLAKVDKKLGVKDPYILALLIAMAQAQSRSWVRDTGITRPSTWRSQVLVTGVWNEGEPKRDLSAQYVCTAEIPQAFLDKFDAPAVFSASPGVVVDVRRLPFAEPATFVQALRK